MTEEEVEEYEKALRHTFLPAFARYQMQAITAAEVNALRAERQTAGAGRSRSITRRLF
jgi:hypothetical protein